MKFLVFISFSKHYIFIPFLRTRMAPRRMCFIASWQCAVKITCSRTKSKSSSKCALEKAVPMIRTHVHRSYIIFFINFYFLIYSLLLLLRFLFKNEILLAIATFACSTLVLTTLPFCEHVNTPFVAAASKIICAVHNFAQIAELHAHWPILWSGVREWTSRACL